MLILAGRRYCLADPQAVVIVNACAQAFDRIGLPEGQYPLAQAALYLATAPKIQSGFRLFRCSRDCPKRTSIRYSQSLKDNHRDQHSLGHGVGYAYPHAYREHWGRPAISPSSPPGQFFYQLLIRVTKAKSAIASTAKGKRNLQPICRSIRVSSHGLSYGPTDSVADRWLQRTIEQTGQHLAHLREKIFDRTQMQRHHLVLDLHAMVDC